MLVLYKKKDDVKDLDFIYQTIKENHPGVCNRLYPHFNANLNFFYQSSKQQILISKDEDLTPHEILNQFTQKFNDSHLWIHWFDQTSQSSFHKPRKKIDIQILSKDITWISLPTFDFNKDEHIQFQQLKDDIRKLIASSYIIFDLRGNQGGNSDYSNEIISLFFGEQYTNYQRCIHNKKTYVDWRASLDNLQHIIVLQKQFEKNSWLDNIKLGMENSIKHNQYYFSERTNFQCGKSKKDLSSFKESQFIILIDQKNVSAALDFIDGLKMMTSKVIKI